MKCLLQHSVPSVTKDFAADALYFSKKHLSDALQELDNTNVPGPE